ncbi:hypothetical protein F5883DRAFT_570916 [Diaporthe sp. PMI_573]|nr:hypothetical protein F5883DRAFT_595747 [Diaporthaceae sp. PMI_573]KAH8744427.1 hypothetical protein F5883DRAFT_589866 [Diaporthaceae sp. PMI_573]KAH8755332.1 hypothetical protein F5883DRAFT_570916 [Diaporthaceae sp. PMI_573]
MRLRSWSVQRCLAASRLSLSWLMNTDLFLSRRNSIRRSTGSVCPLAPRNRSATRIPQYESSFGRVCRLMVAMYSMSI